MVKPLNEAQTEILYDELDIDAGDLTLCDFSKMNTNGKAWTDGKYLIFSYGDIKSCDRPLYYIGAENEAELEFYSRANRLAVFGGISESRLERVKVEQ